MIKTNRSITKLILLSILTLGIYSLYFWWIYIRDLNIACKDYGKPSPHFLVVFLLTIITCGIYFFFWMYQQGERIRCAGKELYGLVIEEKGSAYLFWFFIGLIMCGLGPFFSIHFLIANLNALAESYNRSMGLAN